MEAEFLGPQAHPEELNVGKYSTTASTHKSKCLQPSFLGKTFQDIIYITFKKHSAKHHSADIWRISRQLLLSYENSHYWAFWYYGSGFIAVHTNL